MRKFIFSRVHYTGLFGGQWRTSLLSDLIEIQQSDGFIIAEHYGWNFVDVKEETIDNIKYITGRLIKIDLEDERITIDEHTKKELPVVAENVKLRECFFIIDVNSHLISFETSKTLTKKQFKEAFIGGFKKLEKPYDVEFDFTYDEDKLIEKLEKVRKAFSAHFTLKTTNPDSYDEFKELDELFQKSGIDNSNLWFKTKPGKSLNIKDQSSLVRQALSMSAAGYGGGTIRGEDNLGQSITIQTGESIIDKIEVVESADEETIKKKIIIKFNNKKKK